MRCYSSSTALGTRTGYWKPTRKGPDETHQSLYILVWAEVVTIIRLIQTVELIDIKWRLKSLL